MFSFVHFEFLWELFADNQVFQKLLSEFENDIEDFNRV